MFLGIWFSGRTSRRRESNGAMKNGNVEESQTGSQIQVAAFSPDGRRLVSGSTDGSLKAWDPDSGRLLFETAYAGIVLDVLFAEAAVLLTAEASKGAERPGLHRLEI